MDPTYPFIPLANFLSAFILVLALLARFRQPWNTGVWMLALWLLVESFMLGVNTIVWADTSDDLAPVWCDISAL